MDDYGRRDTGTRSQRATPDELREAAQRQKEREEELQRMDLAPETRHGEERLDRYERELRLQAMREEFQATASSPPPPQMYNTKVLALVMVAASFLLCSFCAGGTYFGLRLLGQAPDAQTTANNFWNALEIPDYSNAYDSYVSPGIKVQLSLDQFAQAGQNADKLYGVITSTTFVKQQTLSSTRATLTYTVIRTSGTGQKITYPTTLIMVLNRNNTWSVDDFGTAFTPK